MIEINSTQLLPQGITLYGPMTEEEYRQCTITGRIYRLTYVEYYIEPKLDMRQTAESDYLTNINPRIGIITDKSWQCKDCHQWFPHNVSVHKCLVEGMP